MKRRALLVAAGALALPLPVRAQRGIPRIGVVYYGNTYEEIIEGLRVGLKEIGLVEGRDLNLDIRSAHGNLKEIEEAARAFEAQNVALIYSVPTTTTHVVKKVTVKAPVVFSVGTDPIASGFVASYGKPGGRFTGVHYLNTDLTGKRIELLKDVLPKLSRVYTLFNPGNPAAVAAIGNARDAAGKLGVKLIERHVSSEAEMRAALDALKHADADALLLVSDALIRERFEIVQQRTKAIRMPTMVYDQVLAERGALLSYGVDTREVGRHSAKYVQRVLSGARPGDLPVENVTRLTFVLNRRTAKEIGLTLSPAMLVRFDRVIE